MIRYDVRMKKRNSLLGQPDPCYVAEGTHSTGRPRQTSKQRLVSHDICQAPFRIAMLERLSIMLRGTCLRDSRVDHVQPRRTDHQRLVICGPQPRAEVGQERDDRRDPDENPAEVKPVPPDLHCSDHLPKRLWHRVRPLAGVDQLVRLVDEERPGQPWQAPEQGCASPPRQGLHNVFLPDFDRRCLEVRRAIGVFSDSSARYSRLEPDRVPPRRYSKGNELRVGDQAVQQDDQDRLQDEEEVFFNGNEVQLEQDRSWWVRPARLRQNPL